MDGKGQISTLGLVIGLVVLIVVALALIMVVTGRIGAVGTSVGEQTTGDEGVFADIKTRIGDIGEWGGESTQTTLKAIGECCTQNSECDSGDCGAIKASCGTPPTACK